MMWSSMFWRTPCQSAMTGDVGMMKQGFEVHA